MVTGETIRDARKRLGESQADFGKRFGVDQSTVARWENGAVPKGAAAILMEQFLVQDTDRKAAS